MNAFFIFFMCLLTQAISLSASSSALDDQAPSFKVTCTHPSHTHKKFQQMVYCALADQRYETMRDLMSQLTGQQIEHAKTKKKNP